MNCRMRRIVPLLLALHAAWPAQAAGARVASVVDGDTLTLDDGRTVRLAGIEAAKPPPGREEERRWPLAEGATQALAELALGRGVELRSAVTDRYGRVLALVLRDDGTWLQDALLKRGFARVHTRPDARERAAEMLAAEAEARAAQRGIWRTRVYAVRPADPAELRRDRDSFQIVEGRVQHAARVRDQIYLNYGEDWRTDVTVRVGRDAARAFARALIDPLSFAGCVLRVRGWITERNGPMIEATHPEQIERVECAPAPKKRGAPEQAPQQAEDDEDTDG